MYISDLTIIGSEGQAIIWTNAGILINGPLGTSFSEFFFEINAF